VDLISHKVLRHFDYWDPTCNKNPDWENISPEFFACESLIGPSEKIEFLGNFESEGAMCNKVPVCWKPVENSKGFES
jgi:hypothetical protein